jgi:hypothetical protein
MTHFKTSKAELILISAPNKEQREKIGTFCKDEDIKCKVVRLGLNGADSAKPYLNFSGRGGVIYNVEIPEGYTLIGKLSEVSEEVAKGLVDGKSAFRCYHLPKTKLLYRTAIESLTSIATHLGMDTNDNIYILKRI